MIAEAFENAWIENTGSQPVAHGILVDVVIDGEELLGDMADTWWWVKDGEGDITHWRLHKPLDTILPVPRVIPPTPSCKPSKSEKKGKLSDEDILGAFNKLTGNDLSADAYEMLLSLQEMFDMRDDICF